MTSSTPPTSRASRGSPVSPSSSGSGASSGSPGSPGSSGSTRRRFSLPAVLAVVVAAALLVSGLDPYDRATWLMETFWIVLGLPAAVLVWRRFPLTGLLCCLLAVHALILVHGGQYTYARTPAGEWLRDWFGLARNPYDRIGHFAQGFVPAVLLREILVRRSPLRGSRWLAPLTVCGCLAFSAFFELLEWWAALIGGSAADDFLATQGDVWDTQWDMFLALTGAASALLLLSRVHDRQLAGLEGRFPAPGPRLSAPGAERPAAPGGTRAHRVPGPADRAR